jgi:hypothetical protein
MASPQARPAARSNRRRQRSTRLTVATALVGVAALVVLAAVLSGTPLLVTLAAVLAVVLGATATRITHAELVTARRDAARDRAAQAQAYLELTTARNAENAAFAETMHARMELQENLIQELETGLTSAQQRAADATRKLNAEARRADAAERDGRDAAVHLEQSRAEAEQRAVEAMLLVSELEQRLDVVRAELDTVTASWHAAERKRA